MREIISRLLTENGMTENTVKEAIKVIEESAYKEGYERGMVEGQKKGIRASIRAVNGVENNLNFYTEES